MTCDQARRLISLHRPGERSEKESGALEDHLHSCTACREVVDDMQSAARAMSQLIVREPFLRDGDQFTHQIMANTSARESSRQQTWFDVLLFPAQHPAMRIGLAAVVLAAVISFGTQTYQTLRDVHTVEQRFAMRSGVSRGDRVKFEVDISHVQVTKEQKEDLRRIGAMTESNTRVLITDRLLDAIWSVFERPRIQDRLMPMYSEHLDLTSLSRTLKPYVRARLFQIQGD